MSVPASREIKEATHITGANASLSRASFLGLGGFDENFHVASGEDRELAMRALKQGIRIYFNPQIAVGHNDWAGTSIRDYCRRQRTYTQTEPFFWKKYGDEMPRMQLVRENTPPNLGRDGIRLYCWKHTKKFLGSNWGQRILIGTSEWLEKRFPKKFLLWKFYKLAIAGSIYRGFNDGLKIFDVDPGKMLSKS
jgi:GT2 family glycosyltransferase